MPGVATGKGSWSCIPTGPPPRPEEAGPPRRAWVSSLAPRPLSLPVGGQEAAPCLCGAGQPFTGASKRRDPASTPALRLRSQLLITVLMWSHSLKGAFL